MVKCGPHKGLKGRVIFADDNIAKVELLATDEIVMLNRDQVTELKDPTKPILFGNPDDAPKSFDDAAQREMGAVDPMQALFGGRIPGTVYNRDYQ